MDETVVPGRGGRHDRPIKTTPGDVVRDRFGRVVRLSRREMERV